jgi:hypothetical protein
LIVLSMQLENVMRQGSPSTYMIEHTYEKRM